MRFLFSYWVIFFIFLGFGFVLKEELPDLRHFLLNMVGLNCSPLSYVNVSFAWYVNFYILFILISPLILYLTKGSGKVIDVFAFTVWLCLMQITQLFNMTAIHILFEVGLIPLSAYFLTKYNILSILQCHIKNGVFKNMLFISAILFSRYFIRHWLLENTGHSFIGYFDCIFTPLFIICTLNLIRSANDNSIILKFLVKIGSLSMNMWFLHSVFFTGSNKLQWILYLPRYSFLIFFWGLFLTFIFAIPVSWLQRCILNRLFNISF